LPLFLALVQQYLADDPETMRRVLAALRRYQRAPRGFLTPPGAVLLRQGRAALRAPRGLADIDRTAYRPRTILVPSPINAPAILDMDTGCSFAGWLGTHGHAPALVDWGATDATMRGECADDYALSYLVPMLRAQDGPVHLIGYCLGGLVALAAACHVPVQSLTLIATPWHFSGFSGERRAELAAMWAANADLCRQMGLVPMELIQSGFWTLAGRRMVDKFLAFADHPRGSDAERRFVAIEDWANGGEPLPFALGQQLFEQFYGEDRTGTGRWQVGGVTIDPKLALGPALEVDAADDAIVPLAASPALPGRQVLPSGHVGMVIGRSAPDRLWQIVNDWLLSHGQPC